MAVYPRQITNILNLKKAKPFVEKVDLVEDWWFKIEGDELKIESYLRIIEFLHKADLIKITEKEDRFSFFDFAAFKYDLKELIILINDNRSITLKEINDEVHKRLQQKGVFSSINIRRLMCVIHSSFPQRDIID